MQDRAHKNMLAQEQRRLMDDDMKKMNMRAKRLATRKKMEILEKEYNAKQLITEVRSREQKMVDYRYRNRVMSNKQQSEFSRHLDVWARKGFTNAALGKDDIELSASVDMAQTRAKKYMHEGHK